MIGRPYNILFLCTGNSARSIMAESILRKDGAGHFNAFSAGSHPKAEVNPFALQVLEGYDYPTENLRTKSWDEFAEPGAPEMDFVFTVCDNAAGEDMSDLARSADDGALGDRGSCRSGRLRYRKERAFVQAFKYLRNRISVFLSLPLASIDKLLLDTRLREIGRLEGSTSYTKAS